MKKYAPLIAALWMLGLEATPLPATEPADAKAVLATLDPVFQDFMRENHVPGLVFGVVSGGKLVYVRGLGVQDTKSQTPVDADSVFRIASMSKQFAALATLKLRDAGSLELEAPAERYVAELAKLH